MLNSYLHKVYRYDKITNQITNTVEIQFDKTYKSIEMISKQNCISTATWGVDIFEKELNIVTNFSKVLDERKEVIKAKWRGSGKLTLDKIKLTCDSFTNSDVEVDFNKHLIVRFSSIIGNPPNLEDVYNAIEDIKPAHLAVDYIFRYRTHEELEEFIHDELVKYTYDELLNINNLSRGD